MGNDVEKIIEELDELGKKYEEINFVISPPFMEKISNLESFFSNIFDSISIKNHIYLYNNPEEFGKNEINPTMVKNFLDNPIFSGIIDTVDNINFYKSYIQMINENFSFLCAKEENFQKFLQLMPVGLRKYSGIIPDISNLTNICSKLYYCAIEDKILDLHQLQDQLIDIRDKIYDTKTIRGKMQRGLKYAFLHLYKDIIPNPIEEYNIIIPELERDLDSITKGRIEATVNYLVNQKTIYRLYSLNKEEIYQLDDIINTFSNIDVLLRQGKIKKIIGPYDANVNTIYRVNFENNQLIFRFRTIEDFKYENLIKEKLLFPFLDGSLNTDLENFREKVKDIINTKKGDYIFNKDNPPIIPVSNLIYYDETKELIPYMFSVHEYLHGKSLKQLCEKRMKEHLSFNKIKLLNLFKEIGEILAKLHMIKFEYFYPDINNLGKEIKFSWLDIFNSELEAQLQLAKRYNFTKEKQIMDLIKDNISLLEDENEPILIHNDFQWTNMIIKDDNTKLRVMGIIDFDNWKIGVKPQDFIKIEDKTLSIIKNNEIKKNFYEGYQKYHKINNDFYRKIDLYSILYYLKKYISAMQNHDIGESYLNKIDKKIYNLL